MGLTSRDIILFNQIIGFVGFQARAIAVLQAAQGFPVRWIPVCPSKRRHPRSCSPRRREHGRPDIADPDLQYADDERQRRIAGWQSLPGLGELAPLLACDPTVIRASGDLDPPAQHG
ncbi:oxidoreductase [Klebsiella pneumoniae subsp. ozaenae]|uniref:Oxidoreductase n=1 Tax=Klebsiella pneumoniae subsp. ozaenae TaxID=574 RepID=A0A377ZFX8_KLEPO|nr:oxidoreductase [Klebsiella pneumoniae subsp. ozaenae]